LIWIPRKKRDLRKVEVAVVGFGFVVIVEKIVVVTMVLRGCNCSSGCKCWM
jgi:hypothetical protein